MEKVKKTTYSYQEVLKEGTNYFNGDELAGKVFVDKYSLKDKNGNYYESTPKEMHNRLASEFARIEEKKFKNPLNKEQIFELFDKFKYIIPAGSPMYGIGNDFQIISLSNCYVLETPQDSYSSILKIDEQLVNISKRRGGVGINLSNLRPDGSPTNNAAISSTGITTWMERYSNSIREVGQNSRRGALMLTLAINHYDIEKFITVKNDKNKVTGANISVMITKDFVDKVEKNEDFVLQWPINSESPKIKKVVKARYLWDLLIKQARDNAEPGILMWDNVLKGPADCYESYKSVCVNPCMPSWSKLISKNGIKNLKDISIGDEIWSKEGWTKVINKWSTGIKKVFKYETSAGVFYGTKNHKLVSNGEKIEAKNCDSIDIISGEYDSLLTLNTQDIMDGLVLGDGSVHKASNNLVHLCIGENDGDYFTSEIKELILKERKGLHDFAYEIKTSILAEELPKTYERSVPSRFYYGDKSKVSGFLRGLFSANGSVCGNRVTLKTSSLKIREQVQTMLSFLGIVSYFTTNKSSKVLFSNGEYLCKESYDINISIDREKFRNIIGFIQSYKNEKLDILIKTLKPASKTKNNYDVISISEISEEEVFDITVDNNSHTFWTQGCNVSNCAEISLSSYDSCRLLCLNLFSYVTNPFKDNASFNYKLFHHHTKIAQRLMDDLVDLESEKIVKILNKIYSDPEDEETKKDEVALWTKIKKFNDEGRRTGLGITALGDALAALNIKYGSDQSIEQTERIYKQLKLSAYESSVDMAEELGGFKDFDTNKEKNNEFLLRIQEEAPELYARMQKYGRRNIALLTTAPTGTVSIMTQTSSGIEPVFQLSYIRRKKVNHADKGVKIDFIDQNGDKWQEFTIYHPKIVNWMEATGQRDITKSPWFGCTANDVNWINRVNMQAAAQKHVCHAISSTINLPNEVSEETVSKIYQTAFSSGCKGITIYRDGCRSGVLINREKSNNTITKTIAQKRPKKLEGKLHFFNFKGNKYFVAVGLMEKTPYEIFTGFNSNKKTEFIPKECQRGFIIKNKRSDYIFVDGNTQDEYRLNNGHADDNADALTRIISCSLRHGSDISFIIHQLEKTSGDLTSFSKCLARTLKEYIDNGKEVFGEECPECKSKLNRENGCIICKNCGYSKCT
jgi:ribonucleotide reductase alpha subunit